ncbi:tRNA pseudouridine(38-40) synthase TruA [uncultured Ilyobacter sp.]|uniref:tRNA pseudouridine(38-40) synthase TruA n=1 Tax=uncultured Ilyobacter sp. TaxID=544433 RepID=UPI0029C6664A|nr:tRNA pseudouridine(38-40) synthase TruA [uncultured Ilyobacter sp.]
MKNIKIEYEYDGSGFFGFQRQLSARTVQGEIESALRLVLKEEITLNSSGRTDRGVHAYMQVSNFFTTSKIPIDRLEFALKNLIPGDIKIHTMMQVPEEFHARFSAKSRAYEYIMGWDRTAFETKYVSSVKGEVEPEKLEKILEPLVGRHNFEGFRLADCSGKSPVREISEIKCYKKDRNKIGVYIRGNAFLKSQIRIIMGTALAVYFGKRPKNYLINKLKNPDNRAEKIVAEGSGLYLCDIEY